MSDRFYEPGQRRAARVLDLFAAVAPRYDLINDLQSFGLHRCWKRRFIRLAGVQPRDRVLDLCCGTGDITFALARRCTRVTGLDFSAPMLAMAQARRARLSSAAGASLNPQFLRGDALKLPFLDGHFDVVTIAYGLRNLASFESGLREMWRVTRPGGTLLVLDFGKPVNPIWRSVYLSYLKGVVPLFGRIFCGNAATHAYILESLEHYPAQDGVARALRQMNCQAIRSIQLLGGAMSIHCGTKGRSATRSPGSSPDASG